MSFRNHVAVSVLTSTLLFGAQFTLAQTSLTKIKVNILPGTTLTV